jgi:hypothetical protein
MENCFLWLVVLKMRSSAQDHCHDFRFFLPKTRTKNWTSLTQNAASYVKSCSHSIGFQGRRQSFCRKWVKIVENGGHNIEPYFYVKVAAVYWHNTNDKVFAGNFEGRGFIVI